MPTKSSTIASIVHNAARPIAGGATALLAGIILGGWACGNRRLIAFVPNSLPMNPVTALTFLIAAIALYFTVSRKNGFTHKAASACAAAVAFLGLARLVAYCSDPPSVIDRILFPKTVARVSAEIASTRIVISPNTAITFILIGAALLMLNSRRHQLRFVAFILALLAISVPVLTIGGYFIEVAAPGSLVDHRSMSIYTATCSVLLAGGILMEISVHSARQSAPLEDPASATERWRTPGLDNRIVGGFAAAIFMLAAIGIISHKSFNTFVADSHWSSHTSEVLASIHALRAQIKEAESDTRGYVISGEQSCADLSDAAISSFASSLDALKSLTADNPVQQRRIEIVRGLIAEKSNILKSQALHRGQDDGERMLQRRLVTDGDRAMVPLNKLFQEMEDGENDLLARRTREATISASRSVWLISIGTATALVLVTFSAVVISRDLAGRVRAETALRASDKLFRGLLESAPDAMVIVNDKGGIEFFNQQAESLFCYAAEELRGKSIEMIIPPQFEEKSGARCDYYFAATSVRGSVVRDLFAIRKDGTKIPVEISFSPMHTADGLRVSSAIRDVTRQNREAEHLKCLNVTLQTRTIELEAANKELEAFSYSVSHDLRTPLRSIDGFSQALLEDNAGKLDAESQDHLHRVRAASQRMGQLIDDLLKLARVTRVDMRRQVVDLSRLAREIIDELRLAEPDRRVDCVIADGLYAQADPALLRIVLANLLGNAWKFTANRSEAHIEFGYADGPNAGGYFVRDDGAGFDMTYAEKLFGAFQRLHLATEFPGTGIGLATVQRIVHRHGGRVWAEGNPSKGATFHFALASAA